jgi:hypothetical protein
MDYTDYTNGFCAWLAIVAEKGCSLDFERGPECHRLPNAALIYR